MTHVKNNNNNINIKLIKNPFFLKNILLLTLALLTAKTSAGGGAPFTYDKDGKAWVDRDGTQCDGQRQSPIDFNMQKVKYAKEKDPTVDVKRFFDDVITKKSFKMKIAEVTKGHAVKFDFIDKVENDQVKCAQFHFHIDKSEHTMSGKNYFAEVHIVCHRAEYADLGAAVASGKGDALLVFGSWLQASKSSVNDGKMVPVIEQYKLSASENSTVDPEGISMMIPTNGDQKNYFRYEGSLTTPECNEIVIWTMFRDPIFISSSQATEMEGWLENVVDNNRLTLPQGERVVYVYGDEPAKESFMYYIIAGLVICVIGFLVLYAVSTKKKASSTPGSEVEQEGLKL